MRSELIGKAEGDLVELDGRVWQILAVGIDWQTGKEWGVLLKPITASGQGQGQSPKPPVKREGTQHRQKVEKKKWQFPWPKPKPPR
jgi:hypothetical protein